MLSEYTTNRAIRIPGGIVHAAPPSFLLRDRGDEWFMEWHGYSGPTLLNRLDHSVRDKQPPANSRFWRVAQFWFDQGGKVVDGVGVWSEPATVIRKYRRLGGRHFEVVSDDAEGDDIRTQVEYEDQRYWNWLPSGKERVTP